MYFAHFDDPTFERFGGLYIPFATQEEAERQIANDLASVENDPKAINLLGIFQAEYGSHPKAGIGNDGLGIYDYNKPFGHLDPNARKKVHDVAGLMKIIPKHQANLFREQRDGFEDYILGVEQAKRYGLDLENSVPGNAYTICSGGTATGGAIALVAATAKTVIGLAGGANNAPSLVEFAISFDGVTASAVPVLVEAVSGTNATNPPGTASTTVTPKQVRGVTSASVHTAAYNWTTEPTVLEVYKKRLLTPNGGLIVVQLPLGREPTGQVAASTQFKFVGYRLTAPAVVNTHIDLEYEE